MQTTFDRADGDIKPFGDILLRQVAEIVQIQYLLFPIPKRIECFADNALLRNAASADTECRR